ncbi:hypothetical protein P5V15_003323 [Pogonomyrmex californicus]
MDALKLSIHTDYDWAIGLSRISLKVFGVWPENNETKREKYISNIHIFLIINIAFCGCLIPSVHSLIKIWGDLMSMIDNLQYTLAFVIVIIKLLVLWLKKRDILPLLNMIKNDWLKPKTANERDVMIKQARAARMLTLLGFFIMLLTFILGVILPVFGISTRYMTNKTDPGKLVPMQTYYIYDRDKSPLYEITFIVQSIGLSTVALVYTSTDSFLGLLIFHICGQLENLKTCIIHLDKFSNFESGLSHIVQDHVRLVRSMNTINNTFMLMLLGTVFFFIVLFAFNGFLLSVIMTQDYDVSLLRIMFIMIIFLNTLAHTCLYCAIGEILIAQCEGVYEAACEYKWYTLEPKKARNLILIIIRANKALYLTAGKLFPLTMSTFCTMIFFAKIIIANFHDWFVVGPRL